MRLQYIILQRSNIVNDGSAPGLLPAWGLHRCTHTHAHIHTHMHTCMHTQGYSLCLLQSYNCPHSYSASLSEVGHFFPLAGLIRKEEGIRRMYPVQQQLRETEDCQDNHIVNTMPLSQNSLFLSRRGNLTWRVTSHPTLVPTIPVLALNL